MSFLAIDFQHFQKVCGVEDFYKTLEEKPKEALLCVSAAVALHKVPIFNWNARLIFYVSHIIFIVDHETLYIGSRFSIKKVMTNV